MILEIIKSEGIAHRSYFLGSNGEAAIIDPRRDVDIYLELADKYDMSIRYIFETHRNEDYTIGSLELKRYVNAEILHGSKLNFQYGTPVIEGDTFKLGSLKLEVLETPGHTYESISIVVKDSRISDDPYLAFVGDLIFAGETGRVDFFGKEKIPETAELMFKSIHEKIIPLGDHVILCPAHGAGSICGAEIRDQDLTTVGYEKITNPFFKMDKDEFIEYKFNEKLYKPPYFKRMEENNLKGAPLIKNPFIQDLEINEFKESMNEGAQVVDIRNPTSFCSGHIPKSLNIWADGFASFAGYFLNYEDPILLVSDDKCKLDMVRRSLIRLGYDNMHGSLSGGFPTWYMAAMDYETITPLSVHELNNSLKRGEEPFILDVRKISEREKFHINRSKHIWLGDLPKNIDKIPDREIVVYCDSGYKSTTASSILKMNGYKDVKTVLGGINAWWKAGYPIVK